MKYPTEVTMCLKEGKRLGTFDHLAKVFDVAAKVGGDMRLMQRPRGEPQPCGWSIEWMLRFRLLPVRSIATGCRVQARAVSGLM